MFSNSLTSCINDLWRFQGFPEHEVFEGAQAAMHGVYWVMLMYALPMAVLEHLMLNYSIVGWLHVLVPLLYLPCTLKQVPIPRIWRLRIGGLALTLLGLSVNQIYGWEPHPGLYFMVLPAVVAHGVAGGRAMLSVTAAQMALVTATTLYFHPESPQSGVLLACATWLAVVLGLSRMLQAVLKASISRSLDLERLTAQYEIGDSAILQTDYPPRQILNVRIRRALNWCGKLAVRFPSAGLSPECKQLRRALADIQEPVLYMNELLCAEAKTCSQRPPPAV